MANQFLPITKNECLSRGWDEVDFVYVCGDAYVDHPSFGAAIISRVLENAGFRVAFLSQPDYKSCEDFKRFGRPRLGFLVSAGNIDSMVAHYTASKKKRSYDYYSPGGKMGKRPDRAVIVYCNRIREAYGDVPIIIGGLEASLRRFSHYDYWDDKIRRSVLVDSRADILTYGMGESIILRLATLLDKGVPIKKIRAERGCVYLCKREDEVHFPIAAEFDFNKIKEDKREYARAFGIQYKNQDAINGKAIVEYYDQKKLVQNPPAYPLERDELDRIYDLPYARTYHPVYEKEGGVPAISEVRFSITHNRGCFGGCNFCALAFHQGRSVRSRSIESVVKEAKLITEMSDFKGYIHDIPSHSPNISPRRYGHVDQHVFGEDAVARGGVVDEDVGDGAHQLAVLDDGRAAHPLHDAPRHRQKVVVLDLHREAFRTTGVAVDIADLHVVLLRLVAVQGGENIGGALVKISTQSQLQGLGNAFGDLGKYAPYAARGVPQ